MYSWRRQHGNGIGFGNGNGRKRVDKERTGERKGQERIVELVMIPGWSQKRGTGESDDTWIWL